MITGLRFSATAFFNDTVEPRELSTSLAGPDFLLARSPAAAACIWYWRLTENERAVCTRLVVGPWIHPTYEALPSYTGVQIEYFPERFWLGIVTPSQTSPPLIVRPPPRQEDANLHDVVDGLFNSAQEQN